MCKKKFLSGMKPNQPRAIASFRNSVIVGWSPFRLNQKSWYILQRKDEILGWSRVYMGFKTQTEVGKLAPGSYYKFRLQAATENEESDWSDILFAITKDNVTPASHLHRVVENGPVTSLRKILSQRYPPVDIPNKQGLTSLRLAILRNNTNFMGILLSHGADIEDVETGSERTPLMIAAQKGLLEPVQLLTEKGSSWETRDRNGLTAFNYAVDNSHLPIVQFALEENVNVKIKDRFGWTPFIRGVLKASLDVLTYLLDNGSNPNEADDRRQTVLMQAVLSERPEVVQILLEKGADINIRNVYGHSAYDLAKSSTNEVKSNNSNS